MASPGSSDEEVQDRQRSMNELETMWRLVQEQEEADEEYVEEEDEEEEEEEDEDEFFDDDDEEFDPDYDQIEEDDEDEEFILEDMEADDDEDESGDNDDDDSNVIDLATILQAASTDARDGQGQGVSARTARALSGIGLEGLRTLLRTGRLQVHVAGRGGGDEDDEDGEDEEDDSTLYYGGANRRGASSRLSEFWDPIEEPIEAGKELLLGGEFKRPRIMPDGAIRRSPFERSRNLADRIIERKRTQRRVEKSEFSNLVPNTNGTEVARYPARCYIGQYSQDSSFFYTCTQDFRVHMYDTTANQWKSVHRYEDSPVVTRSRYGISSGTSHLTSLRSIKTIQGRHGSWTITDANLSPDNQWMIYSSITPYVYLVPTRQEVEGGGQQYSDNQVMLDFSNHGPMRYSSGIWSLRFSGDSREIVAGAQEGEIYVYDIEARQRVLRVEGHMDDVNGVAFADSASSNVLISGSDDSFVKVWDRRSLSGGKPAGVFVGHTEGITYVAPKGDGRYCISNGKDQSLKLWDLRKMVSSQDFEAMPTRNYGLRQWDYRNMYYKKPRYLSHPQDCSVMTYRGHAVLRTLIRCHFSPIATTGQKYVYSGSADGRIHIWSLDGRVVQVLDRSKVTPLCRPGNSTASDPSAAVSSDSQAGDEDADADNSPDGARATRAGRQARSFFWNSSASESSTVRDVSWHSSEPTLMSTAWDGPDGQSGSIAKHEWKGFGKNGLSLEDAIQKSIEEADAY